MFIAKATLNPQRREAKRLLSSPQRMHAAVLAGFSPGERQRPSSGRILWRLDPGPHHVDLLVVSPGMPDFTGLIEDAGWPATTPAQAKDYSAFLDRLARGSRWHYRLRANPVRAIRLDGWPESKRVGHVSAEAQAKWWLQRAQSVGLLLLNDEGVPGDPDQPLDFVAVTARHTESFGRTESVPGPRGRVSLTTAVFEGNAEVVEPVALREAMANGIGRARAYGCGLLTLVSGRT